MARCDHEAAGVDARSGTQPVRQGRDDHRHDMARASDVHAGGCIHLQPHAHARARAGSRARARTPSRRRADSEPIHVSSGGDQLEPVQLHADDRAGIGIRGIDDDDSDDDSARRIAVQYLHSSVRSDSARDAARD